MAIPRWQRTRELGKKAAAAKTGPSIVAAAGLGHFPVPFLYVIDSFWRTKCKTNNSNKSVRLITRNKSLLIVIIASESSANDWAFNGKF